MASAQYTFLPWFRRGIMGLQQSAETPANAAVSIPLRLDITPQGATVHKIEKQVKLYGPGDITGIDRRMVVRTIPRMGTKTFESNFLCGIEFYDEDFPWRYTPLKNKTLQLSPWIWLVALQTDEFVRNAPINEQLPVIEIIGDAMKTAFPDPATTWAWAHTHLNFQIEGATLTDKRNTVTERLRNNPESGCSRLLCPRHLKPLTTYTAFLVPAFEKGRLAGLGADASVIDNTPNVQPSWTKDQSGSVKFPVYYEWQFTTDSAGDFESLAKRLAPLTDEEKKKLKAAKKTMSITNPGWGLTHTVPDRELEVESALRMDDDEGNPNNNNSNNLVTQITDETNPADKKFVQAIADLLNLGVGAYLNGTIPDEDHPWYADGSLEDDPIITPPLYGAFYRNPALGKTDPGSLFTQPNTKSWYHQLNLNPVFRVAASKGTSVVQKDQDALMDRAWDQREAGYALQQVIERWHYSVVLSNQLFARKIEPLISDASANADKTWTALSFIAPMNNFLSANGKNFNTAFQERTFANIFSASFRKLVTKNKNVKSRTSVNKAQTGAAPPPGGNTTVLRAAAPDLVAINTSFIVTQPKIIFYNPTRTNFLHDLLQQVFDDLHRLLKGQHSPIINPLSPLKQKDALLNSLGYAGYSECKSALFNLAKLFEPKQIPFIPPIMSDAFLYSKVASQVKPISTIAVKVKAVAGLNAEQSLPDDWAKPQETGPVFPEPMFEPLADISTDFILPGLSEIPVDRVAMMISNKEFIESYMLGLNHEISREFLWREFPAPLNGTPFRQFWDTRNVPDAANNPEKYKDIKIIRNWNEKHLGDNRPANTGDGVVLLVRGELFRKYPYTEVFMQKAEWLEGQVGIQRKPTPGGTLKRPIFSARIDPDYQFFGFNVTKEKALNENAGAGYYFVLRERAGEIQFGLDYTDDTDSPAWTSIETEVPLNHCINVSTNRFKALQSNALLRARSDGIASLLYQKPFSLFVHAARLIQ
ncbi:hypothetical protein [Pollutibacter soli]|uniref:hypothetical protein n=1 Tax=Pollutibacter soli TaxID=3034157 RepID=UPI0030135505